MHSSPTYSTRSLARLFVHPGEKLAAGFAENHVHVLAQADQAIPVVDLARHLEGFTSRVVRTRFADFPGWQEGYYAETVNWRDLDRVARYLREQRDHHKRELPGREVIRDRFTITNLVCIEQLLEPEEAKPNSGF